MNPELIPLEKETWKGFNLPIGYTTNTYERTRNMLYHASKQTGLKLLEPCSSTHGKAYVYAIRDPVTAVCFGAPKDDFDLMMDEADGKRFG